MQFCYEPTSGNAKVAFQQFNLKMRHMMRNTIFLFLISFACKFCLLKKKAQNQVQFACKNKSTRVQVTLTGTCINVFDKKNLLYHFHSLSLSFRVTD